MKVISVKKVLMGVTLIVVPIVMTCCGKYEKTVTRKEDGTMRVMTIAKIYERTNNEFVQVTFLESAQFYKLMISNKSFDSCLSILNRAKKENSPVKIRFTEPHGNIIETCIFNDN